jgi:hypothetical protein
MVQVSGPCEGCARHFVLQRELCGLLDVDEEGPDLHDCIIKGIQRWKQEANLNAHKVITCGVVASHPDAGLSRRGAYAGKWDSPQAEKVRALRDALAQAQGKVTNRDQAMQVQSDNIKRMRVEIERLTACLATSNANHEKFEREWYMRVDEIERLQDKHIVACDFIVKCLEAVGLNSDVESVNLLELAEHVVGCIEQYKHEAAPADGFADALSQSLYGNDPAAVACAMQHANDVEGDSTDAGALRRLAEEVRRCGTVNEKWLQVWDNVKLDVPNLREDNKPLAVAATYALLRAENQRLRSALDCLLPGLVLDLRYASEDEDRDAMRSRIDTVRDALES